MPEIPAPRSSKITLTHIPFQRKSLPVDDYDTSIRVITGDEVLKIHITTLPATHPSKLRRIHKPNGTLNQILHPCLTHTKLTQPLQHIPPGIISRKTATKCPPYLPLSLRPGLDQLHIRRAGTAA